MSQIKRIGIDTSKAVFTSCMAWTRRASPCCEPTFAARR